MIQIKRNPSNPDIAVYSKVDPKTKKTRAQAEQEAAIAFFTNPANYFNNTKLNKEKFNFKVYKDTDLAYELDVIFKRKCAYCESQFGHLTPREVEHFRPKSEIEDAAGKKRIPGYYWLAGEWTNLLSTCVDCNRARLQEITGVDKKIKLGKEIQFPLSDEKFRAVDASTSIAIEDQYRLLLNPCQDEPEQHLTYNRDALILPRNGSSMGTASIHVYALQRKGLVEARKVVLNQVQKDLQSIARELTYYAQDIADKRPDRAAEKLAEAKSLMKDLKELLGPNAQYLGMVRDYIRWAKANGDFDDFLKNGLDPESLL